MKFILLLIKLENYALTLEIMIKSTNCRGFGRKDTRGICKSTIFKRQIQFRSSKREITIFASRIGHLRPPRRSKIKIIV